MFKVIWGIFRPCCFLIKLDGWVGLDPKSKNEEGFKIVLNFLIATSSSKSEVCISVLEYFDLKVHFLLQKPTIPFRWTS